jgi:hypothetical protein
MQSRPRDSSYEYVGNHILEIREHKLYRNRAYLITAGPNYCQPLDKRMLCHP